MWDSDVEVSDGDEQIVVRDVRARGNVTPPLSPFPNPFLVASLEYQSPDDPIDETGSRIRSAGTTNRISVDDEPVFRITRHGGDVVTIPISEVPHDDEVVNESESNTDRRSALRFPDFLSWIGRIRHNFNGQRTADPNSVSLYVRFSLLT